jgi:choline kinase
MSRRKEFITSVKKQQGNKLTDFVTFILLSENHGHRMKSYGPVSLVKIKDKTILEQQIEAIQAVFLNYEIIICCGYETFKTVHFIKDNFDSINIRVVENQMHFNSNCCESIRLCLSNTMNEKIIISSGAVLFSTDQLSKINLKRTSILSQPYENSSGLEIGVIENKERRLENLSFGVKSDTWCEVFYLNGKQDIKQFYSIVSNTDFKNKFMFEAINTLLKKTKINVEKIDSMDKIDNIKKYKEVISQ